MAPAVEAGEAAGWRGAGPARGWPLQVAGRRPGTLGGLVLTAVAWASGGSVRRLAGTCEVHGGALDAVFGLLNRSGLQAVTLGHVIVGRDAASLDEFRAHERTHVRQWERWGP